MPCECARNTNPDLPAGALGESVETLRKFCCNDESAWGALLEVLARLANAERIERDRGREAAKASGSAPPPLDASAPPKVWLQIDTDGDPDDRGQTIPRENWGDLTWCYESIGGQEVVYIREDLATPQPSAAPAYDRALIADMLTAYHSGVDDLYTTGSITEQIRLLRTADNAAAADVRTMSLDEPAKASGSAPDELAKIGGLIRTQDNRITDSPIFIVQQKRRVYGLEDGYSENYVWIDGENTYTDEERTERDAERSAEGLPPAEYRQCGYIDIWDFVTACFTEQGCKDYLRLDGHNLREPRIYAAGSYRNAEFRAVRSFLMSLGTATPPASAPEVTEDRVIAAAKAISVIRQGSDQAFRMYLDDARAALTAALTEKSHG